MCVHVCVAEILLRVLGCPTETEGIVAVVCHETVNVMIYKEDYLQLENVNANNSVCQFATWHQCPL